MELEGILIYKYTNIYVYICIIYIYIGFKGRFHVVPMDVKKVKSISAAEL
jgi:hypothetical protein